MISNRSNKLASWLVILFFIFNLSQGYSRSAGISSPLRGGDLEMFRNAKLSSEGPGFSGAPVFQKDTLKRAINREANRASLMSMAIPGLGQVYNKKYWKVPIIYAALGGIGYIAWKYNSDYQNYHNELLFRYSHNQQTNSFPSNPPKTDDVSYTTDQLIILKNQTKKYRDLCIIGMGIVYVLNVIDANVDGHLKKFDVDDNLTMSIAPRAIYCANGQHPFAPGISLALYFK